jgi:hypothetical protein
LQVIAPLGVYDHGDRREGPNGWEQNLRVEDDIPVQADKWLSIQPRPRKPEGVNVVCFGKRRILNEGKTATALTVAGEHMLDDLILLVAHDDPDVRYPRREQVLDLVI